MGTGRRDDARMCPAWYFFQGIVAPGRRANVIEGVREIRKAVGHIFGANFRHMHLLYIIHVVYETYDTHERDTTVGHIFGANLSNIRLLYMIHVVHETYDTHERNSQSSWSHFWGKFQTHAFVVYDTCGI
jgi:hypothetical protein